MPTPVFGTVIDTRGYVLVDTTLDGVPFQFVSTHLDPFHTPLQPLQAGDILAALSGSTEPQLVVGDFNADDSGTDLSGNDRRRVCRCRRGGRR